MAAGSLRTPNQQRSTECPATSEQGFARVNSQGQLICLGKCLSDPHNITRASQGIFKAQC